MNVQKALSANAISDGEIINRILGGEKELYALIIRRYNQRLYRVAMSIINDDAEVEDVMQVAYIKAYENLGKFEFKSGFSTWLTRILINESLLHLRKRKQSLTINNDFDENKINQLPSGEAQTPLMQVMNVELKAALEEAIRKLPEKYRSVFVMRELEGMNVAETKECLNLSEVNVKVRLNRAKAMLQDSLKSFYRQEDLFHFHLSRCDRIINNVMQQISKI